MNTSVPLCTYPVAKSGVGDTINVMHKKHARIENTTLILFCITVAIRLVFTIFPQLSGYYFFRYALPFVFWAFVGGLWTLLIYHLVEAYGNKKKPPYRDWRFWLHITVFLLFTILIMVSIYHSFFFNSNVCCLAKLLNP